MAQYFSPKIVTDGIVSYHDFMNVKCYPRSGTTSRDLVGSNTTTFSGPLYTDGYVNFDGIDDFIVYGSVALGNTFTISTFAKQNVSSGDFILFGLDANGADNWYAINGGKQYVFVTQSADVNNFAVAGTQTLTANVWYGLTLTVNVSTVRAYVNGALDLNTTTPFTIGGWTSSYSALGRRGSIAQRYLNGSIGNIMMYNRALSDNEILQNFNALRGRYNI